MEPLEQRVNELEQTIKLLLQHIKDVNNSIATGFEKIESNFVIVNDKIDALRGNSTATIENVENQLNGLTLEISKINEVTSYEGIFNNTLKVVNGSSKS